jgi:hypothetical protein
LAPKPEPILPPKPKRVKKGPSIPVPSALEPIKMKREPKKSYTPKPVQELKEEEPETKKRMRLPAKSKAKEIPKPEPAPVAVPVPEPEPMPPYKPEPEHHTCELAPVFGAEKSKVDTVGRASEPSCPMVHTSCCTVKSFKDIYNTWQGNKSNLELCKNQKLSIFNYLVNNWLGDYQRKEVESTKGGCRTAAEKPICAEYYKQLEQKIDSAKFFWGNYAKSYFECHNSVDYARTSMYCIACDITTNPHINSGKKELAVRSGTTDTLAGKCWPMASYEENQLVPLMAAFWDYHDILNPPPTATNRVLEFRGPNRRKPKAMLSEAHQKLAFEYFPMDVTGDCRHRYNSEKCKYFSLQVNTSVMNHWQEVKNSIPLKDLFNWKAEGFEDKIGSLFELGGSKSSKFWGNHANGVCMGEKPKGRKLQESQPPPGGWKFPRPPILGSTGKKNKFEPVSVIAKRVQVDLSPLWKMVDQQGFGVGVDLRRYIKNNGFSLGSNLTLRTLSYTVAVILVLTQFTN